MKNFCLVLKCALQINQNYYHYCHVNKTGLLGAKSKAVLPDIFSFDAPIKSHPVSIFLFFPSLQKPRVVPVPPDDPPPPTTAVAPKSVKPSCSQLTQSCVPQSGCCDPCASCHCRFFNAICFCRRRKTLCEKNTWRTLLTKLIHKNKLKYTPQAYKNKCHHPQCHNCVFSVNSTHWLSRDMDETSSPNFSL